MRVTKEVGLRCIKNGTGCAVLSITTPYARYALPLSSLIPPLFSAGAPFVVPSAISKSGVETMTKSLATEWAKYGLRFNAIAPGPFPTEVSPSKDTVPYRILFREHSAVYPL